MRICQNAQHKPGTDHTRHLARTNTRPADRACVVLSVECCGSFDRQSVRHPASDKLACRFVAHGVGRLSAKAANRQPPTSNDGHSLAHGAGRLAGSGTNNEQRTNDRRVPVGWNSKVQSAKYRIGSGYRLFKHRTSHNERSVGSVGIGSESTTHNAQRRIFEDRCGSFVRESR